MHFLPSLDRLNDSRANQASEVDMGHGRSSQGSQENEAGHYEHTDSTENARGRKRGRMMLTLQVILEFFKIAMIAVAIFFIALAYTAFTRPVSHDVYEEGENEVLLAFPRR